MFKVISLVTILLGVCSFQVQAKHTLVIGVLADHQPQKVIKRWQPLMAYLDQMLPEHNVKLHALNYESLNSDLQIYLLDYVLTDPSVYIRMKTRNALSQVLATLKEMEQGKAVEAVGGTIIIDRNRNDIKQLSDLKTKKIAVLDTHSLTGFHAFAQVFFEAGVNLLKDVEMLNVEKGYEQVIEAVLNGSVDAGFLRAGLFEQLIQEGSLDSSRLQVLNLQDLPGFPYAVSTHLYPHWPFIALPHSNPQISRKIAAALFLFGADSELANELEIYGFSPAANYTVVENLLRDLRLPPYDHIPEFTLLDVWQRFKIWIALLSILLLVVLLLASFLILTNRRLKDYREHLEDQVGQRTKALQEHKRRLEAILDELPAVFFMKDLSGRYMMINRQFEEVVGQTKQQITAHTDFEIFSTEMAAENMISDRTVLEKQGVNTFEENIIFPDGKRRHFLTTKAPLLDEGGDCYGLFGIATDVTKLKSLQNELGEAKLVAELSRQMLQTVLDTIPVRVYWKDLELKYLGCNKLFAQDAGFSDTNQILGKDDFEMAWGNEAERYQNEDRAVIELDSAILACQHLRIGSEGEKVWLSVSKIPLKDDKNKAIGILGIYEDITLRKLHEEQLLASEQNYRNIFQASNDAILIVDNNQILDCNSATLKLFDCADVNTFCQFKFSDLTAVIEQNNTDNALSLEVEAAKAFQQGNCCFELKLQKLDKPKVFDAEIILNVMHLNNQNVLQVVIRDISQRKEFEHSIIAAKEAAESTAQAKSDFLANMSHEIRTPLNAVLGMAKIGLRDSQETKSELSFQQILNSGQHLLGVINDILDFSKIEAGKMVIDAHACELGKLIEDIVHTISGQFETKGLGFVIDIEDDFPIWMKVDSLRLKQVLINLLSNAVKFTHEGRVTLKIIIAEQHIDFQVIDTGIGIAQNELSRLFMPFEQADTSTTRNYGGTGLGLVISRNLAQLMGGELSVDSRVGVGSIFTLHLPYIAEQALGEAAALSEQHSGLRLQDVNILAAEDSEVNRFILEDLLLHEGASVTFAENGRQALEIVSANEESCYDLILMDIQMPIMDGYEATRRIKKLRPKLPIIGLTAHALNEQRDKCLAAGMSDHATKPFDADKIVNAIQQLL